MFVSVAEVAQPESLGAAVATLAVGLVAMAVLIVLLLFDLKYMRASRKIARSIGLPKGQWLRVVKTLMIDPICEAMAIAILLGADIIQNWEHAVVAAIGALAGVAVGRYRYGIQYVRAVPEYKAIVFVRSQAEYVALTILFVVSILAEQTQIPVVGPLNLLITALLALILSESISRATFSYRRYRRDVAGYSHSLDGQPEPPSKESAT